MKIKAYAKINLALEVKDEINGYHMLNNIMAKIDLFDELEIKKSDHDFIVNDTIENILSENQLSQDVQMAGEQLLQCRNL